MPQQPRYYVQEFDLRDGEICPEDRITDSSRESAIASAQAMVPTIAGAAAVMVDKIGPVGTFTILAKFGQVPDWWAGSLLGE